MHTRGHRLSHTHVDAGVRADKVGHGQRALSVGRAGVLAISSDLSHNLIWRRRVQSEGLSAYLADYCTPEAAIGRPLELRDAVFLVRADRPP